MNSFWATQLGTTPAAGGVQVVERPLVGGYSPSPYFTPSQPSQVPSEALEEAPGQEVPGQWGNVTVAVQKAQSARLHDTCPDCGSGNIFSPKGMPNMMPQCFECGYNPRFAQMTSGGGLPSGSDAPSHPARQLNATGKSNFNPQAIIDPGSGLAPGQSR